MNERRMRRAIRSGELLRALGGRERDGSLRDVAGLMADCDFAVLSSAAGGRITVEQIQYRLDLNRYATRRALQDLGVEDADGFVNADGLRRALSWAANNQEDPA